MKCKNKKKHCIKLLLGILILTGGGSVTVSAKQVPDTVYDVAEQKTLTYGAYTYEIMSADTVKITGHTPTEINAVVPARIDGRRVAFVENCFVRDNVVKSISFPDTVCSYNFTGVECNNLEKLHFDAYKPEADATGFAFSYGNGMFSNCPKLKEITVAENDVAKTFMAEDNVLYFNSDNKIQLVLYPAGKEDSVYTFNKDMSLGQAAFEGNSHIKEIIFKGKLLDLETFADTAMDSSLVFRNCSSLQRVVFSEGITMIGGGMFEGCTKLTSVKIPLQ